MDNQTDAQKVTWFKHQIAGLLEVVNGPGDEKAKLSMIRGYLQAMIVKILAQ